MDRYTATKIVEDYETNRDGGTYRPHEADRVLEAYQYLVDSHALRSMAPIYSTIAAALIEDDYLTPAPRVTA